MNSEQLYAHIEALLFALGRPMSIAQLSQILASSEEDIKGAIQEGARVSRGVVVVNDGRELELRVSKDSAELIEKVRKEEFSREIGRAGLEALAAVLYRGPLSRSEIDFIRGVNSSQTLRTLLMRGLLRKVPNPKDERSFLYEPTTELLSEFGIERVSEAPNFDSIRQKLAELEASYKAKSES